MVVGANSQPVKNSHRRFTSVEAYVDELGGDKSHVIKKVLIANNGVAAVKAIRSIRRWAYDVFADERAIQFVVMATPEDLRANAEYIRMGDVIVDVPGGSNNHNYANVTLIVELARLHGVNAVWAGWGHASENPLLPDSLAKSTPPIKFIGPAGPPMRALGDKIGSTIIAQTADVPCIAWNGDNIMAQYDRTTGCLPSESYKAGSIKNAAEACDASQRIGFPVMIKASEGGGGKGIRMVSDAAEVANAYRQVCGEVPGSPVFIMKLSTNSRHLEVQLLADEYGDAVALNGRDCSVQRRHQKIIEEGPPIAAPQNIWIEMEKAAVALAKAVGYANAGTVEYLFSETEQKFYFLELNPRLQVEHPVTEMITRVNLPAAQLQVAMGIKLYNIPDIRELYGKNRFEDSYAGASSKIDFDITPRQPPNGHCIAVRITAENAEAGFKPTSGGIQELNFRSTPSVWGYFSMDSSGSIHEYADSQFGHLFANGNDREEARRNMVLALKELSIRGDISTTVHYISKLIEFDDFVNNNIDTGWLDRLIKSNVLGDGSSLKRSISSTKINSLHNDTYAVIGALVLTSHNSTSDETQFLDALSKGQLPSQSLLSMKREIELILDGVKYRLFCTRNAPNHFSISVSGSPDKNVSAHVRPLSDGGYLTEIGGQSRVAYLLSHGGAATGMRISVGGMTVSFSPDYDPTSLRTDVAGKLVKKLVPEGAHLDKGDAYCEIEVMKMFMPLKVSEAGCITWKSNEGAALAQGDLIASLSLDTPDNVAATTIFKGDLNVDGWNKSTQLTNVNRPHILLRKAFEQLNNCISGYILNKCHVEQALENLYLSAEDPMLPVYEIDEPLSALSGRLDSILFQKLSEKLSEFKASCTTNAVKNPRFPTESFCEVISDYAENIGEPSDKNTFLALVSLVTDAADPYAKCNTTGLCGSERVLQGFIKILRKWIDIERWFCDGKSYADAVDILRKSNKDDYQHVLEVCRAHTAIETTTGIVTRIIDAIADALKTDSSSNTSMVVGAQSLGDVIPCLAEIGSMGGADTYSSVSLRARKLLLQESLPSIEERKSRITETVKAALGTNMSDRNSVTPVDVARFLDENIPLADVLYPLLRSADNESQKLALTELYLRKLYCTQTPISFSRDIERNYFKFTYTTKESERALNPKSKTSFASMTDLKREIKRSASMQKLGDSDSESEASIFSSRYHDELSTSVSRTVICKMTKNMKEIDNSVVFEDLLRCVLKPSQDVQKCSDEPQNVLYFIVTDDEYSNMTSGVMDEIAKQLEFLLSRFHKQLEHAAVRRVSFILNKVSEIDEYPLPSIFTFRARVGFKENSLFRNIEPGHAYLLDLNRLATNFNVQRLDSRQTSDINVHLYQATPKPVALNKDKKANKNPRIFVRALSYVLEFSSTSFEKMLVDSLNALDIMVHEHGFCKDNHLFMNLVSDYERIVLDPAVVEQAIVTILKRHGERIAALGLTEVETKLVCSLNQDSPPIALRMVASNPTGYVHVMNTYVEAADASSDVPVFKLIGGTKASLALSGDSSWEGMTVNSPYPLTRPFDAQRNSARKASDSLYCYDLPALFEEAIEQNWNETSGEGGIEAGIRAAARPLMVMYTSEFVVQKKSSEAPGSWDIHDYLNGNLELVQTQRKPGENDVGMVAWLMTLKTFEYPTGRQVVLIANDITHKAGSFGTREDVVFKLASEYARLNKIPRLYVAANSGARIGLSESIKKSFKVAFKNPESPENGFDYLYVTKEDYKKQSLNDAQIIVQPTLYEGEEVYRINDIIGIEPDLGVENLKGSGLIAGETSKAYNEIFTMTIVLGRTVGIGAYLVRLGQRTIQKVNASPIILTGYQALNKLMGVDVYSTNDQLGGPGIMYSNGVSHLTAPDHLSALKAAMEWLSFVPSCRGGLLPIANINGIDSIDRQIGFTPSEGLPYDPRYLLTGKEDDDGNWLSGFFDKGSFVESLSGWAKTVVVGRARLGGIPMGVIATENRMSEAVKPADPADIQAAETIKQEAGCVWFPNSAYKTAQAINDFRTEDLPLIIFANWRGFSGGQRDMFDEVLKYGSLIVDAFVAFEQPVFVFIPPYAEVRGGAWVVLDASINSNVMEMYATTGTARGGVLEANGAAAVKYREKDLLKTMRRIDQKLITFYDELDVLVDDQKRQQIEREICKRESLLLPVYAQIAVQFCDLHDTPGRMKAVGVIEKEIEWKDARSFFFWRLRRKLAEFDLRRKIIEAGNVGRRTNMLTPSDASKYIMEQFVQSSGFPKEVWHYDDKTMLMWMEGENEFLERKVVELTRANIAEEVFQVIVSGGNTGKIGTDGIVEGISRAVSSLPKKAQKELIERMKYALDL